MEVHQIDDEARRKALGKAFRLLLIPVALFFPSMYLSHWGPCGPTNVWSLIVLGISAGITGFISLRALGATHRQANVDVLSLLRLPVWIAGVVFIGVSAVVFLISAADVIPESVRNFTTHFWWFLLFLVTFAVVFVAILWLMRRFPKSKN